MPKATPAAKATPPAKATSVDFAANNHEKPTAPEKGADLLKKGFRKEEEINFNSISTADADVRMLQHANNLCHLVEDISSRFLMLEKRTGCLESAVHLLILKAQTTAECTKQKEDLQMTGKSESEPFLTQLKGISNQGATCYFNSIIQTLFHLPLFREVICQIEGFTEGSVASALQAVFYEMKYSNKPASTSELTASLGWNAKSHEDVAEKFEEFLVKLTMVPGLKSLVEDIFEGSILRTVRGEKTEQTFYVLRIEVEGCKDVQTSFERIVKEELMAGDGRTDLQDCQEATEIPLFGHLPPVLVLHLSRFAREDNGKLNDRYEFPLELDLDIEGLSVAFEKNTSKKYILHSVHAHKGDTRGGHNFVFIRPTLVNGWYKFDDHIVSDQTEDMALEKQFDGHEGSCAYMLVYVPKTEEQKIMCTTNCEHLEALVSTYQSRTKSHVKIDLAPYLAELKEQPPQSKLDWCCMASEYLSSARGFVSDYLDFGLVVNNLLAYTGFHLVLLVLDWIIEKRLKHKIFISMWEGLCWVIAVPLHAWIIRWINVKSHKTAMVSDAVENPIHQLEALVDPDLTIGKLANPIQYIRELMIKLRNLLVSLKKEERYEKFMLFLLAITRWVYLVLKETTSEEIGRGFLGLLVAHLGAMTIELIGAYAAFLLIHKKSGSWFTLEWLL